MFFKAIKNDFYKLYLQMDKLSKKDCYKRFERVFARNLGIQATLQEYKVKKMQGYKDFILIYFAISLDLIGSLRYFLFRIEPLVWRDTAQRGTMKRIRTITETLQMLKQEDPNTGLSEFLIRKLANNYKIRSFKTGNKILIDYDSLMAFLQSQDYDLPMEQIVVR